jgi:nitroreductase
MIMADSINGEQLIRLFKKRQSTRSFSDRPVEYEKLMQCIEAASLAPSACNAQPWKFIIINDGDLKNKIADHISGKLIPINHFIRQAPVLAAIVREPANFTSSAGQFIKDKEYPLMDIGIAAIQFCLQATAEGLGTCMLGWFDERKIKRLLNIPRLKRLELIIAVGYPASDTIRDKKRKETSQILSFNTYK